MGKLVVLTAGGTGGHVFPAEALASALLARGYKLALVTDDRGRAYGGTLGQLETIYVKAGGVAGRGIVSKVRALADIGLGTLQARKVLAKLKPACVVGFGGYASLPATLAAAWAGIPTAIHEQNAVLGRANRLLAPRVSKIATCYPTVRFLPTEASVVVTGNPVRPAVLPYRDHPFVAPIEGAPFRILVIGGSQGARVFSEIIPAAIAQLPEGLRDRLHIAQQCRPEDYAAARDAYDRIGVPAELKTFFDDVPARMASAHLLVCRSGASTMGEVTVIGRPALLVPYPHAIDDHQTANARAVADVGGAWLMPQTGFSAETLAVRLTDLITNPGQLAPVAATAHALGRPDAAERLADVVAELANEVSP